MELLEHVNLLSGVLVSCVLVYVSMNTLAEVTCMYMCLNDHTQIMTACICVFLCKIHVQALITHLPLKTSKTMHLPTNTTFLTS